MVVSYATVAAMWLFTAWVYWRTRVKAALFNLVWWGVSLCVSMVWLKHGFGHPNWEDHMRGWYDAWSFVAQVGTTGSFLWMLLAVTRWGVPSGRWSWKRR
jgi:hypothetical protein